MGTSESQLASSLVSALVARSEDGRWAQRVVTSTLEFPGVGRAWEATTRFGWRVDRVDLTVETGRIRVRYELDGRRTPVEERLLTVRVRPDFATVVGLHQAEARLTGLRRRGLVVDSPRILARDLRDPS